MTVTVELRDPSAIKRFWRKLARIARFSPGEAEAVADAVRQGIKMNFEKERSPDGSMWPQLGISTAYDRMTGIDHRGVPFSVGPMNPILQRTGDLMRSLTERSHSRHSTRVYRSKSSTTVQVGAEDDPQTPGRIGLLNYGGSIVVGPTTVTIPSREFLGLSREGLDLSEKTVIRVIDRHVEAI